MTEHLLNPSEDARFEAAYNHYVDSVDAVRAQIKLRDRLLVIAILLLAVMSLQIFLPQESGNLLSEFVPQEARRGSGNKSSIPWNSDLVRTSRHDRALLPGGRWPGAAI